MTPAPPVRRATAADAPAVRALLGVASLPLDGVPDDLAQFLVADRAGLVIGAIGLERYGASGLLRSAVVDPSVRGTGIGEALVDALVAQARAEGIRELVLLTTTAESWFPRFGFVRITRDSVPPALEASEEFRGACPETAIVMRLAL